MYLHKCTCTCFPALLCLWYLWCLCCPLGQGWACCPLCSAALCLVHRRGCQLAEQGKAGTHDVTTSASHCSCPSPADTPLCSVPVTEKTTQFVLTVMMTSPLRHQWCNLYIQVAGWFCDTFTDVLKAWNSTWLQWKSVSCMKFQKMNSNTHAYFSDVFQYKQNNIILPLSGKEVKSCEINYCYCDS